MAQNPRYAIRSMMREFALFIFQILGLGTHYILMIGKNSTPNWYASLSKVLAHSNMAYNNSKVFSSETVLFITMFSSNILKNNAKNLKNIKFS